MADFSREIPEPVESLDRLTKLLSFYNEEICKKEKGGKSYIYSVVVDTDDETAKERNVVWFKDSTTDPVPPTKLAEFPTTLGTDARRQQIMELEDAEKLELRSAAIVLFANGEKKWVALFDAATVTDAAVPKPGDASRTAAPANKESIGTITPDHWLTTAQRVPIGRGSEFNPRFVVIHYTEGFTADSSISSWKEKDDDILAHVLVDRDGKVFQCRPFNQKCQHAGTSRTVDPRTNQLCNGLNSCSIGIEIANTGMKENLHRKLGLGGPFPDGTTVKANHRNGARGSAEARDARRWEVYPAAQLEAVFALVSLLKATYDIHDITGHDCISPERKADPGPAFPMRALREANGFSGLPKVWDAGGREIPV